MVPNNTLELKESFKSFLVDTKLLVTQSEIVKSLVGLKNVKDQYTNYKRAAGFAFVKFFSPPARLWICLLFQNIPHYK